MSAIKPYAAGSYAVARNTAQLVALKSRLDGLSNQLASGRVADSYGGLGAGRSTALSAQGALSALAGFAAGISAAQTRTTLAVTSLTQVATLGTSARSALQNGQQSAPLNTVAAKTTAQGNLSSALDALNQSAGGSYLFGGRDAETRPVLDLDTILNGGTDAAGKALDGLKTLVEAQTRADLGKDGYGRLALDEPSATSVSLTEDANPEVRANFGFSIAGAKATGSALAAKVAPATAATATATFQAAPTEGQRFRVVVNQADGRQRTIDFTATAASPSTDENPFPVVATPADAAAALDKLVAPATLASVQSASPGDKPPGPGLSIAFTGGSPASVAIGLGTPAAQPATGDSVSVTLALHDGTTTILTLTAAAAGSASAANTFAIGASPEETAKNLQTALSTALKTAAGSTLTVSSTARAAQDFFSGSTTAGLAPRRILFDPTTKEATGYAQAPQAGTVIWYRGEDSGADARATQVTQVSATASIRTGARANQAPVRSVLAGLATTMLAMPASTDSDAGATYQAIIARAGTLLAAADTSPSVRDAVTELSLASARLTDAASTNKATQNTLQNTVDGIEQASTEEVTVKLLQLQNQLQASYSVTASLSKLSLVNYLG